MWSIECPKLLERVFVSEGELKSTALVGFGEAGDMQFCSSALALSQYEGLKHQNGVCSFVLAEKGLFYKNGKNGKKMEKYTILSF